MRHRSQSIEVWREIVLVKRKILLRDPYWGKPALNVALEKTKQHEYVTKVVILMRNYTKHSAALI